MTQSSVAKNGKSEDINNELVDEAVAFINSKKVVYDQHVLDAAIEIGDWVLNRFFDNDFEEATSRDPKKKRSYAALKKREDLEIDTPTLSRMVRVAYQKEFFGDKGAEDALSPLSFSHRVELIRLPFEKVMIETARECDRDELSSRQLKKLVTERLKGIKGTPEKDLVKSFRNASRKVSDLLKPSRDNFFPGPEHLNGLKKAKRDAIEDDALRLQRAISRKKEEVDTFLDFLDQYEPPPTSEDTPVEEPTPVEDSAPAEKKAA
jgi:hypothetical protein